MDIAHLQKCIANIDFNHDYISNLPPDVKERILVKLPIKEAVRTSILSSKWIDAWTSIPNLVFEEKSTESRLVKLVDMVLLAHRGSIENFELVSNHACNGAIGRWMPILSRNGIKDLELRFENQKIFKIPFCLPSCNALERLYLSGCSINVPCCFQGFKLLRSLTLSNFETGICVGNLVSSCLLLEHLSLSSFIHEGCLDIVAPNLTSLFIVGHVRDICLETPELASAVIFLVSLNRDYQKESNFTRALGRLSNIQKLDILNTFCSYLAMGPMPENLPHFNHLIKISVHLSTYQDELIVALCLFQSAPNLAVLNIEFWPSQRDRKVQTSWDVTAVCGWSLFKRLKVLNITYVPFTEWSSQITKVTDIMQEFAKLVLSLAPVLEKLNVIDTKVIFEMLEGFPKLSKNAEILYVERSYGVRSNE